MRTRTMKYQRNEIKNSENLGEIAGIDLFFKKIVTEDIKLKNVNKLREVKLDNKGTKKLVKVQKKINQFEQ